MKLNKIILYFLFAFSIVIFMGFFTTFNPTFLISAYSLFISIFIFVLLLQNFSPDKFVDVLIITAFGVVIFGFVQKFVFSIRKAEILFILKTLSAALVLLIAVSIILLLKFKAVFKNTLLYLLFLAGILIFFIYYAATLHFFSRDLFEAFSRWERVYSTIGNPNYLSAFIIAVLPFILWRLPQSTGIKRQFILLTLILSITLLFVTKTRGALIAAIIAWGFALYKANFRISKNLLLYSAIVVLLSIPIIFLLGINQDIQNMLQRFQNMKNDTNIKTRYQTWWCAAEMAKDHPLIGYGLDNYQAIYPFKQNLINFVVNKKGMSTQEKRAHSEYLQFLAETGAFGLALLLILLILAYKHTAFSLSNIKFYAFVSILSLYIHSSVSFPLHILSPLIVFSFALAVVFHNENQSLQLPPKATYIIAAVYLLILLPQFFFTQSMQYTKYAEFYKSQNDWNNAIYYYKKSLRLFPSLNINYHYLGTSYYMLNNNQLAALSFRKAFRYGLRQEYLFANFGNVLFNLQNYNLARNMYHWGIFIAPRYDVNYYNLGNLFQTLNIFKKAEFYYKRALYLNPENTDVWYNLGNLYYDQKLYDKSIYAFKRVLQLKPKDVKAMNNMAITYFTMSKRDKGINLLKTLIHEYPEHIKSYIDLANIYLKTGEKEKAIEVIKQGLKQKSDKELYVLLGNIYYNQKKYSLAKKNFEAAINIDPSFARAYNNLALVYLALGDKAKALQLYKKAYDIDPSYTEAKQNYLYLSNFVKREKSGAKEIEDKAYTALSNNDFTTAAELYRKLMSLPGGQENYIYKINLGFALYKLNKFKEAEKLLYEGLMDKRNKFFDKFTILGNIYYKTGRADSAIWAYKTALTHNPEDYMTKYNLGAAFLLKGDVQKCYELWTEVKQFFKNDAEFNKNYNTVKSYVNR